MPTTNDATRGRAALDEAVKRFHERVSADPELAWGFEGMDMRRILVRQLSLLAFAAGPRAAHATK